MSVEEKKDSEASTKDEKTKQQQPSPAARRSNPTVSFAAPSTKRQQPQIRQPEKVHNPAKVGKANPKRDIPIFLGAVGFLLLVAWATSGIGGSKKIQKTKTVKQLQDDLKKQFEVAQAQEKARKRTLECGLFLASSSIPGTGLGVFAGKRFEVGDEVVHPGTFYPVDSQQTTGGSMFVSQYGLLLKHHPFLANVEGPTWSEKSDILAPLAIESLKATRVIEPGEELFLSFSEYPLHHSDVVSIPTLEDYQLADMIVNDEIRSQRRGAGTRKTGALSMGGGGALLMVKRSVEKFNKKVAALLPGSSKALESRDLLASSSAFSALNNKTISYLEANGQCLDDVMVNPSSILPSGMGLFTRRLVKKGSVIVPVPLYAKRRHGSCFANNDSCTAGMEGQNFVKHCFSHKDSSLLLCPLSSAAFIRPSYTDGDSMAKANAALKWSSRINVKNIHKVTVDDILVNYTTRLGLDVIALRAIQPGEQIVVGASRDSANCGGAIQIEDSLYSAVWKDYERAE